MKGQKTPIHPRELGEYIAARSGEERVIIIRGVEVVYARKVIAVVIPREAVRIRGHALKHPGIDAAVIVDIVLIAVKIRDKAELVHEGEEMDVIALEHELNSELLRFKLALKRAEALLLIPVIDAERREEEPARDTACFDLFNAYLRSGAATQLEMLHRFTDLCAETCRQREENETHSTQAIIKRINRYIEDNVENYDLSLTALARMTGFNPSYLSRFYRINTGKKLSDQIDEAKLQHAKKLIAQGELVKNVAERTGFASPSAFILFFKRNTGVTPRQYFESENKS